MKYHQIDFMQQFQVLEQNSVDLVITSVPMEILEDACGGLFQAFSYVTKPSGIVIIDNMPDDMDRRVTQMIRSSNRMSWRLHNYHFVHQMFPGLHQGLWVFAKDRRERVCYNEDFKTSRTRPMNHRTEFCHTLIQDLIKVYSQEGYVVLDPFCGTGTVPGEAHFMARHGIGCDLRPIENLRTEYAHPGIFDPWKARD